MADLSFISFNSDEIYKCSSCGNPIYEYNCYHLSKKASKKSPLKVSSEPDFIVNSGEERPFIPLLQKRSKKYFCYDCWEKLKGSSQESIEEIFFK